MEFFLTLPTPLKKVIFMGTILVYFLSMTLSEGLTQTALPEDLTPMTLSETLQDVYTSIGIAPERARHHVQAASDLLEFQEYRTLLTISLTRGFLERVLLTGIIPLHRTHADLLLLIRPHIDLFIRKLRKKRKHLKKSSAEKFVFKTLIKLHSINDPLLDTPRAFSIMSYHSGESIRHKS